MSELLQIYQLLSSNDIQSIHLGLELAYNLGIDWGEKGYRGWFNLYQTPRSQQLYSYPEQSKLDRMVEIIQTVHNIDQLHLESNQLKKLPTHAHRLIGLKRLSVQSDGRFGELTKSSFLLQKCLEIDLSDNSLKMVPEDLIEFKYLERLVLSKNQLRTIPDWIGQFQQLKVLHLQFNQIKQLPSTMQELTSLHSLWLAVNQLKNIPDWLPQLKNLKFLYLFENHFKPSVIRQLQIQMPNCSIYNS